MTLTTARYCYTNPRPAVSTDMVIFTIRDQRLTLLLVPRSNGGARGKWALPGGAVRQDEDPDDSARRLLREETGADVYLEQLYTFGRPGRDPREHAISVAYYALIPSTKLELKGEVDGTGVGWFAFDDLPALAFDHAEIVAFAQQRLAAKLDYSTIALQFMPEKFTLSELQGVYETILRAPLDKRNFRKRVLALDSIEETNEERRDGAHRPARLYRLKRPGQLEFTK
ncbi:MAG: NUDIX hydrolase [Gammaproteobacteria bacterium]|nr:NUDIX hydrolase [Gammaproteobacteria bacterium]